MSIPTRNSPLREPSERESRPTKRRDWTFYTMFGLAAGAIITGGLWLALEMRPHPPTPIAANSAAPAPTLQADAPDVSGQVPKPEATSVPPEALTMGLAPADAAVTRGNWHYDHEQWDKAIVQYRLAMSQGMDNPDVRTDLGNCYRFAGQPQRALDQYRAAQKLDPRHENSLFNQGGLLAFSLHQPSQGIALWNRYLQQFPRGKNVKEARRLIAQAQELARQKPTKPRAKPAKG